MQAEVANRTTRQLVTLGLPVIQARNGAGGSQYAKALFYAGWLDALQGRHAQALPPMRQALAIHESRVAGRDRGMLQVLRTALSQVLIESGQEDADARALLDAVIAEPSEGDAIAISFPRPISRRSPEHAPRARWKRRR